MNTQHHLLAADQRLSQSFIWSAQRQFFAHIGIDAWRQDIVPHHISCNPIMARTYSRLTFAYLQDWLTHHTPQPNTPFYIVELGAGSGRLGHHFLTDFHQLWQNSPHAHLPVKLILTDFTPTLLHFWSQNPTLQQWHQQGWLDFALFDAQQPQPLTLLHDQTTIPHPQHPHPTILLANYFFDSIPQDCFLVADGLLHENLLSAYGPQPDIDLNDTATLHQLTFAFEPFPARLPYYHDPNWDAILAEYEQSLPDTVFVFPQIGLNTLRFWHQNSPHGLLLLTADKGYTHLPDLYDQDDPDFTLHGSFSLMVNYHALGRYTAHHNGLTLTTPHYQNNLQLLAFLFDPHTKHTPNLHQAFTHYVTQAGPDDFFALKLLLETQYDQLDLPQLLSYLRLTGWDPQLLLDAWPHFCDLAYEAHPVWHDDIRHALSQIHQTYLPLSHPDPLLTAINDLLTQLDCEPLP
ncbi:MAG TPA: SAM-dependent methyltransferase [Anaerolineae bacterium]|nr:SAM-dependent methyltransferase [Anaerolineae bacterium]